MEKITKKQILESIGKVYEQAKDCELKNSFFKNIDPELTILSQYFKTSETQTFFIAIVFALNYKGDSVNLNDLIAYFKCNPMKILEYNDELEVLTKMRILKKHKSRHRVKLAGANDQFTIHKKITEAILQNLPMPEIYEQKIDSIIDLLAQLYKLSNKREDDKISTHELFSETEKLMEENSHFPLIEKIKLFDFNIADAHLFLYLIWKGVTGNESINIEDTMEIIYENPFERINEMQKFWANNHILVKNNLMEIISSQFSSDAEMKLTDVSFQLLKDCDIELFINKKKKENIIVPSETVCRELFFDSEEMSQLNTLEQLLNKDKFDETQTRLAKRGLPKGITVLLYGAPGTGKTEIVKQLAKVTNREIMKVEISQTKSLWFGESEKIIKKIFTDYRTYAKDCELTPILLFNEADAVISKRQEANRSKVSNTENAIQNIILEELENFDGILMATTNLVTNMDKAFERRFLFKVLFKKPKANIRAKIWKSKLVHLNIADCNILAAAYDLSGGQIENIVRKSEIEEIVNGKEATLQTIQLFCEEESIEIQKVKIGFSYVSN